MVEPCLPLDDLTADFGTLLMAWWLIATASGMSVAIPSLLLHAFLSRKAKAIVGSMEQTSVGFINGLPENAALTFD